MTDDSGRESRGPARMTPERVRSLLEAATPGPWRAWKDEHDSWTAVDAGEPLPPEWDGDETSAFWRMPRAQRVALTTDEYVRMRDGDAALIAAVPEIAHAYLRACVRADAAYAQGALDMRTRAAAVALSHGARPYAAEVAAEIEALDLEVPQ